MNTKYLSFHVFSVFIIITAIFLEPLITQKVNESQCKHQLKEAEWITESTAAEYKESLLNICYALGNISSARALSAAAFKSTTTIENNVEDISNTLNDMKQTLELHAFGRQR